MINLLLKIQALDYHLDIGFSTIYKARYDRPLYNGTVILFLKAQTNRSRNQPVFMIFQMGLK
jgi:hypothetical protein